MSSQKALLLRVANALSTGDIEHVGEWFTEDFQLHQPGFPEWPRGHAGAQRMLASIKGGVPKLRAEVLDMVEEGDRVAARWRFSGNRDDGPWCLTSVAIYRFSGGRIAEDWGVTSRFDWQVPKAAASTE